MGNPHHSTEVGGGGGGRFHTHVAFLKLVMGYFMHKSHNTELPDPSPWIFWVSKSNPFLSTDPAKTSAEAAV
jgi:hypothetical protein